MNSNSDEKKIRVRYNIAKKIAVISAAFFLILSILMIANYIQTKSVDPLNSSALNKLMLSLQENPNDTELKEQIRALDLLARRAYFTNQRQTKTGSYLLLIFALALFASLKSLNSLKRQFPDLTEENKDEESWENKLISKRYFTFGSFAIFIAALFAGLFAETNFDFSGLEGSNDKSNSEVAGILNLEDIRENWPQFRGPEGNGIVYNNASVPTKWDGGTGENIIWKVSVPFEGFNSPIIWDGKNIFSWNR